MSTTQRLQRATLRVWLAVGLIALLWVSYRVLARPVAVVLAPIALAMLIVQLLGPVVNALARFGVPRWAGTLLSYVAVVLTGLAAMALILPSLAAQARMFAEEAPLLLEQAAQDIDGVLEGLGVEQRLTPSEGEDVGESLETALEEEPTRDAALAVLGGLSGFATGLLHLLLVAALGPIIAFYLLVDLPRLRVVALEMLPPVHREEAREVGVRVNAVVGGFVRGQLLVALFVGVVTAVALGVLGLPFWLVLGVIAGVCNVIPLAGPFIAGGLGIAVALLTGSPGQAVAVLAVMTVVQQLDNHVISPVVMGRTVRLHPLVVMLALLVSGTLFGILGLFLAVPLVATVHEVGAQLWRTRVPWAHEQLEPEPAPQPGSEDQPQSRPRGLVDSGSSAAEVVAPAVVHPVTPTTG